MSRRARRPPLLMLALYLTVIVGGLIAVYVWYRAS